MPDPKFSLKDHLFNREKVAKLASEIQHVYPIFKAHLFLEAVLGRFPELELKARIDWIVACLADFLPNSYPEAVSVMIKALPAPCDPRLSDDDFGDFIYAPYSAYVAKYGCERAFLDLSFEALKAITTRFSAEDAIRTFINAFPDQTLARIKIWAQDPHYHVRRLASEGTRPKLPWAKKIAITPEQALPILSLLYTDSTRFVTRSVANHLNDWSKLNPEVVFEALNRWQVSGAQKETEMAYMIRHSLRTLIKQGHPKALEFFNVSPSPQVDLSEFSLSSKVYIGDSLHFNFQLTAKQNEQVIVDYIVYFQNKSGMPTSKKVYKLAACLLKKNQVSQFQKQHKFRADMTTRALFPGLHHLEIQLNGQVIHRADFELLSSFPKRLV